MSKKILLEFSLTNRDSTTQHRIVEYPGCRQFESYRGTDWYPDQGLHRAWLRILYDHFREEFIQATIPCPVQPGEMLDFGSWYFVVTDCHYTIRQVLVPGFGIQYEKWPADHLWVGTEVFLKVLGK